MGPCSLPPPPSLSLFSCVPYFLTSFPLLCLAHIYMYLNLSYNEDYSHFHQQTRGEEREREEGKGEGRGPLMLIRQSTGHWSLGERNKGSGALALFLACYLYIIQSRPSSPMTLRWQTTTMAGGDRRSKSLRPGASFSSSYSAESSPSL